jgi:hypothetical protein
MNVVVLEDAAADLEAGKVFYERREAGVGEYFQTSLLSDLSSLALYAGIHKKHFGFHWMLSKRFPFGIYYELEGDTAFVYAVLDLRQHPPALRSILQRRK